MGHKGLDAPADDGFFVITAGAGYWVPGTLSIWSRVKSGRSSQSTALLPATTSVVAKDLTIIAVRSVQVASFENSVMKCNFNRMKLYEIQAFESV